MHIEDVDGVEHPDAVAGRRERMQAAVRAIQAIGPAPAGRPQRRLRVVADPPEPDAQRTKRPAPVR